MALRKFAPAPLDDVATWVRSNEATKIKFHFQWVVQKDATPFRG